HARGERRLVGGRGSGAGGLLNGCEHARRRRADPEQPALALVDHLEADGAAVERRRAVLELPQRVPLRLADRLARALGGQLGHRRLPPFFLRLTRRGGGAAAALAGCGALIASGSGFFAGVWVRRGHAGAGVFGIRRRVISPWPTVHRFVVTQ